MQDILYHFRFADGTRASCAVEASPDVDPAGLPAWTALEFQQCPNCPLQSSSAPHCPMAVRLVPLITLISELSSFDRVDVHVTTPERSVSKATTVQRGISALMGLLVAGSGCPHTGFLKPMAHFHLPFASEEETIYRAASTYLLGQYFLAREGGAADWDLAGLKARYLSLQTVNGAMAKRLRSAVLADGAVNAFILLDLLAKALPYSIDEQLDEIKATFR
ncbi:hypothetical protein LJR289_001775 [Pseudoduganella sp. LjRoot289]|uniref:DUF6901 family protein n=1 Tax=Pseudoduganella sp. LjRoot289 TaxID=3342314 RepID=UPI003ECF3AB9